jgi:hypothetical protein
VRGSEALRSEKPTNRDHHGGAHQPNARRESHPQPQHLLKPIKSPDRTEGDGTESIEEARPIQRDNDRKSGRCGAHLLARRRGRGGKRSEVEQRKTGRNGGGRRGAAVNPCSLVPAAALALVLAKKQDREGGRMANGSEPREGGGGGSK